jgi:Uma2 family endonuclease
MSTAKVSEFVSVADYLASEDIATTRSEYIEGWVRAMTGATNRHNRVKLNCLIHLGVALKGQKCQPYDSDTKVRIRREGRTRFYYPDLQVVCESNPLTEVYQDAPVAIVEVLSPSSRQYDLDEKLAAFLEVPSLECYIILEQHTPIAIVMRRTEGGFLRECYHGVEALIQLPFLACSLTLRDVYEGVEFTATCVQEPIPEYEVT